MKLFWESHPLFFGYSIGLGMLFDIIYEPIRWLLFLLRRHRIAKAAAELLFFALLAIVGFLFFLVFLKGQLRIYPFIGFFIGWCILHFTVGNLCFCRLNKYFRRWEIVWKKKKELIYVRFRNFSKILKK